MHRIGLLSDTHSYTDDRILHHLKDCDEIWHAGDFGSVEVSDQLEKLEKKFRGVYGNIDGHEIRIIHPLHQKFEIEGIKVWITHIGGYPGRYSPNIKNEIIKEQPDLFITGHSHILKVMHDPRHKNILHMNPGAAGIHGFHKIRTMLKFDINNGKIENVKAIELGTKSMKE